MVAEPLAAGTVLAMIEPFVKVGRKVSVAYPDSQKMMFTGGDEFNVITAGDLRRLVTYYDEVKGIGGPVDG